METRLEKNARPDTMLVNMGPSHPAMHGTFRIMLELEGERILNAEVEIGYLHRGFEKTCENKTYFNLLPYTDRLNYVSPLINNLGYAMAMEKLLGLEVPERAQQIRVLMSELSRVSDHLTCLAAMAMENGRLHRLPLYDEGQGVPLGRHRAHDRRADDDLLHPDRRGPGRPPPGLARRRRRRPSGRRGPSSRTSAASSTRTRSSSTGRATSALCPGRTPSPTAGPAPACARPASATTSARPIPISSTTGWTSTSRSASAATTTTATCVRMREMEQSLRIIEQVARAHPGRGAAGHGRRRSSRPRPSGWAGCRSRGSRSGSRRTSRARRRTPTRRSSTGTPRIAVPPKEDTYTTMEGLISHFYFFMNGPRHPAAQGRGLFLGRGRERRARLLHRLGRDGPALPAPPPGALLPRRRRPRAADPGPVRRRRRPDLRVDEHDRRGARPMSFALSPEAQDRIDRLVGRYPGKDRPPSCRSSTSSRESRAGSRPRRSPGSPPRSASRRSGSGKSSPSTPCSAASPRADTSSRSAATSAAPWPAARSPRRISRPGWASRRAGRRPTGNSRCSRSSASAPATTRPA